MKMILFGGVFHFCGWGLHGFFQENPKIHGGVWGPNDLLIALWPWQTIPSCGIKSHI